MAGLFALASLRAVHSRFHTGAVVGSDEEAAVLLPVAIGELITALERLVGREEVFPQIDEWLDDPAASAGEVTSPGPGGFESVSCISV
jgi:hypothetical protein